MVRIATICGTFTEDVHRNIHRAEDFVRSAVALGADWVVLPEVFVYRGDDSHVFEFAEEPDGVYSDRFGQLAAKLGITLFAGSWGEKVSPSASGADKVYNVAHVFGPEGRKVASYRKVHLFNLAARSGHDAYREADSYIAGRDPCCFEVDGFRVGLVICYDLRFPGWFQKLQGGGPLDIFVIPAAFTLKTGLAHWEVLLRSRAIENITYVVGANQVGHGARATFGHSMVVDPWGHVIANTGGVEGIAIADVTAARIKECRGILPALDNRRPELYD